MKRAIEAKESPSPAPYKIIPPILAESPPAETSTDQSIDLGESLMKLPFELRQKILFSFTLKERSHLRLVNKAMRDAVDVSMSDVEKITIYFDVRDHCRVTTKTINPYNGAENEYYHRAVPSSSLPFLLKWIGAQLRTLKLSIYGDRSEIDYSHVRRFYRGLETLNSENICPKLKNLKLHIHQNIVDDYEILLSELLKYVTKRQLQAMVTDHPTPFLHSLSLVIIRTSEIDETSTLNPLDSEKRRKLLQDILDQCHGLKELDVDSLLVWKDLPIVALRYPTTLTHLKGQRLGKTFGDLSTIVDNCPNLQIVDVRAKFRLNDTEVHSLASLSDLRELELFVDITEDDVEQIISQGLAAFEDHPFGASVACPWPQLEEVTLNCYEDESYSIQSYRLLLSGANCCITSLHLTRLSWSHWFPSFSYADSVEKVFKALNSENACPNLMELSISDSEFAYRIRDGLIWRIVLQQRMDATVRRLLPVGDDCLAIPKAYVYGILNDLLTYVTKRQSEVRLGKPFLRSLSISRVDDYRSDKTVKGNLDDEVCNQLEQIRTTLQQILDQCHGLEELYMKSLDHGWVNPDRKKGRELMKLVPLRFPTTLKKLNYVSLD